MSPCTKTFVAPSSVVLPFLFFVFFADVESRVVFLSVFSDIFSLSCLDRKYASPLSSEFDENSPSLDSD